MNKKKIPSKHTDEIQLRALKLDLLSINQATLPPDVTLESAIKIIAKKEIGGIAVWRDKLLDCGVTQARSLLQEHDLVVTGLCRAGMFCGEEAGGSKSKSWDQMIDDNFAAIDEAAEINAQVLIIVAGGIRTGEKDLSAARTFVADGLHVILERARDRGVILAIEPLHPVYCANRSVVSTMKQALDLCDVLGSGIGVAVDAYHTWWDPDLHAQIIRAGPERLLAFHICDWLRDTRDPLLDRGMMGDGVIDLQKMRGWMEAAGYSGLCEVEIFSERNWWQRRPQDVVDVCADRFLGDC